jgi:hypothetical protein
MAIAVDTFGEVGGRAVGAVRQSTPRPRREPFERRGRRPWLRPSCDSRASGNPARVRRRRRCTRPIWTSGGGEFFSLLGASGSGKSTPLRLIGDFERPGPALRRRHTGLVPRASRGHPTAVRTGTEPLGRRRGGDRVGAGGHGLRPDPGPRTSRLLAPTRDTSRAQRTPLGGFA